MLADLVIRVRGAHPDASHALAVMADALAEADRTTLTADDRARIDRYQGGAADLHALLAAVLPLARARWYETSVTARQGTAMVMGYLALPAPGGIDVAWCCYAPAHQRLIGPLGPVRVTPAGMARPADMTEASWREIRSATSVILRALLLGL